MILSSFWYDRLGLSSAFQLCPMSGKHVTPPFLTVSAGQATHTPQCSSFRHAGRQSSSLQDAFEPGSCYPRDLCWQLAVARAWGVCIGARQADPAAAAATRVSSRAFPAARSNRARAPANRASASIKIYLVQFYFAWRIGLSPTPYKTEAKTVALAPPSYRHCHAIILND